MVGVDGKLQVLALEVIGQKSAIVTIHALPTGVRVAKAAARGHSIVTNVDMQDVNTSA